MTEGETRFYLREIGPQWSTSNVSIDKLAGLEAAYLIQINPGTPPAVRLTAEGARRKSSGRPQASKNGLPLRTKPKSNRLHSRKKPEVKARPLV
jgi:hypothetical protein